MRAPGIFACFLSASSQYCEAGSSVSILQKRNLTLSGEFTLPFWVTSVSNLLHSQTSHIPSLCPLHSEQMTLPLFAWETRTQTGIPTIPDIIFTYLLLFAPVSCFPQLQWNKWPFLHQGPALPVLWVPHLLPAQGPCNLSTSVLTHDFNFSL